MTQAETQGQQSIQWPSSSGHGLPRPTSADMAGSIGRSRGQNIQTMLREDALVSEQSTSQSPKIAPKKDTAVTSGSSVGDFEVSASELGSDDEEAEEIRRLDEDFQKNLQRAKKVFYNRMDNLQRSQVEREAQHQKTLEKHEKERIEFEKRLAQEAEQQNRRIEQLQREWDQKRLDLAQQMRKPKNGRHLSTSGYANSDLSVSQDSLASLPTTVASSVLIGGHTRSGSSVSSNFSVSPAITDKKLLPEPREGQGGNTESN